MQPRFSSLNTLGALLEEGSLGELNFRANRRKEPRYAASGSARVSFPKAQQRDVWTAQLLDISGSGMRLGVPAEVKPGTMVEIELETLNAVGIVRYCRKYGADYSVGIRLDGILVKPVASLFGNAKEGV